MIRKVILNRFSLFKPHLEDILSNYKKVSNSERLSLIFQKSKKSVVDPEDGNNISNLSDLTSFSALLQIKERMLDDPIGRQILQQKPRITNQIHESLKQYPQDTFGKAYFNFLDSHGFHPEQRPVVKYIPDFELAYILQRYKQIHDFIHVLLFKQISINDELVVKWFQMVQLKLPSTSLAAMVSPFMMGPSKAIEAFTGDIPQAIEKAKRCKFVMNIYFQKHFAKNLEEFKKQIGIEK